MGMDAGISRLRLGRLRRLARWTVVAWSVVAATNLVAALLPLRWYLAFTSSGGLESLPFAGLLFPDPELRAGLGMEGLVGLAREEPLRASLLLLLLYLIASPLLMAFLFRAHRTLAALQAPAPRYAAHWTVTGFLVPFANLVMPFLVVRDLWRAGAAGPGGEPTAASASPLPRLWWEIWLVGVVLGSASGFLLVRDPLKWAGIAIAAFLVNCLGALMTILLVRGLLAVESAREAGTEPRVPLSFLPAGVGLDAAVLAFLLLAAGFGQRHVAREVQSSFERMAHAMALAREARETAPPVPLPAAPPPETEKGFDEGTAGGVEGGVPGGTPGAVSGVGPPAIAAPAAAADDDRPLRVAGDVSAPVKVSGEPPEYTEVARQARIQGIVILEVVVDRSGNVTDARVIRSLPMGLDQRAVEAVRRWKFRPAMRAGRPVAAYFVITVSFRLG